VASTRSLPRKPSQAQVDEAELLGADLSGCVLRGLDLRDRDLSGSRLIDCILADADLSDAVLDGADLSDTEIDGARFERASLRGARLCRARGDRSRFDHAVLDGADLTGAVLVAPVFEGASLERVTGRDLRIEQLAGAGACLDGAALRDVVVDGGTLAGGSLRGADLAGASLVQLDLTGSSLSDARLGRARLDRCVLERTVMEGTQLPKAVLRACSFEGVVLSEIDASGATVRDPSALSPDAEALLQAGGARLGLGVVARLKLAWAARQEAAEQERQRKERESEIARQRSEAEADERRRADEALRVAEEEPAAVPALRTEPDTEEEDVATTASSADPESRSVSRSVGGALARLRTRRERIDADLVVAGASLRGADLRGIKLRGRDLTGIDLREARLEGANLTGANLHGARLAGARLDRARLKEADLGLAIADGARFEDAILAGACLEGLRAHDASFIGAVLSGARFGGADLARSDFSAGQLADVDLADADLSGTLWEQADLAGAQLDQAVVADAEIGGALGLSSTELDALRARGAFAPGLGLGRFGENLGASVVARGAAALFALALGSYLVTQYLDSSSLSEEDLEDLAAQEASAGELDQAVARYADLIERTELPADRALYRFDLATLYSGAGLHDAAIESLREATAEVSGDADLGPEARLRLAKAFGAASRHDEAVAALEALLSEGEGLPAGVVARASVALSDEYARMGFPDKALAMQRDLLDRYPHNPGMVLAIHISRSEILEGRGEYEAARAALDTVREFPLDDEQQARLMEAEARLFDHMGDTPQSLAIYRELLTRYPSHPDVAGDIVMRVASLEARGGSRQEARRLIQRLLEQEASPRNRANGRLLRAQLDEDEDLLEAAREGYQGVIQGHADDREALEAARAGLLRVLIRLDPQGDELRALADQQDPGLAAQLLLGRADAAAERGEREEARSLYQQVLDDFTEAPGAVSTAHTRLADLYVEEGRFGEAVNAYRALLDAPLDEDGRVFIEARIADALRQAGRLEDAATAYRSLMTGAQAGSEAMSLARLGLAQVAQARGDVERARLELSRVVDETVDPTLQATALEALASSYLEAGQEEEALAGWRRYLSALPPGHEAILPTRLEIARILQGRGEIQRARALYQELLVDAEASGRDKQVRLALAELQEASGDHAGALASWRRLMEAELSEQDRTDVVLGLGRALLATGDAAGAQALGESWASRMSAPAAQAALLDLRVQALRALGDNAQAEVLAARLLEVAADDGDAAFSAKLQMAIGRLNEGDAAGAVRLYEELLAQVQDRPTQAALRGDIAQAWAAGGDPDAARAAWAALSRDYGDLAEARFRVGMGLAELDRRSGQPEAAASRYRELVAPDPGSDTWRQEQLAQTLLEAGQDAEAEALFKALVASGSLQAQLAGTAGLAGLLRARDELTAARALYLQVAQDATDPGQRAWATLQATQVLVDEGRLDDAFFGFRDLAEAGDPEIVLQAKLGMANVYLDKGKPDSALERLEALDGAAMGPAWDTEVVMARIAAYEATDAMSDAAAAAEGLLARWPVDDDVQSRGRIRLAELHVRLSRPDDALSLLDAVLGDTGDRFYQALALLTKAQALRSAGREGDARGVYQSVVADYHDQGELVGVAEDALSGG